MTREEQAKKDCAIIVSDDMECGTPFAHGYNRGIEAGAKWADSHPNWHKYPDEKPDVKGKRSRCFIVALEYQTPDGKPIRISTPALWGDEYKEQGFSYIPNGKFYWGPDVFDNAFAWMELPEPPKFD